MAIDRETQLLAAAAAAGITRPRELANFMAQVSHESNGLNRLEEGFRYTRNISQIPVQSAWREGPEVLETARIGALQGRPEKLAELMYGGRNGNERPGEGYLYRGRGYMQLTGKDNYRAAGDALDLDLVKHPELAAEPTNAARIAVWYWQNRVPEAAREDVKSATRAINGRYNGLDDRQERFVAWERRLTPEVMERLAKSHAHADTPTPASGTPGRLHQGTSAPLKEGSDGDDVRRLQASLSSLGYKDAVGRPLKTDGDYGPSTTVAVKAFQRDAGIKVDGVVGRDTIDAIEHAQDLLETGRRHRHHHHHPHGPEQLSPLAPALNHASHPDHALFRQARDAVYRLDTEHRREPDQHSENLAAALTVAARHQGMHRIDHVALSEDAARTYAVQGDIHSPHKQVAEVATQQAIATPLEQSAQALARQAAQAEHEQRQAQQASQQTPPSPSPL
ncbi:XVIPCD domain-containing protein [Luteibacter yeojuensis]